MKKLLSAALCLVLLFGLGVGAFAASGESDGLDAVEIDGEQYVPLEAVRALLGGGETTVLKGAKLLDSQYNGEVLDVLVQDGKIVAVGENLSGDKAVDLSGYTLLPGLIDAHVHVSSNAGYNLDLLAQWASMGITSVREEGMLSTSGEMEFYDLIQEANADPANATLVSCGKYLDVAGGYGMGPTGNMGVEITTPEEAVAEVEYKAELGYTQVKVGINSDESRMTGEELTAIIDTAHENGMPVAAHINYAKYLEELVGYGIDEAAHTPSDEMSGELIGDMVEKGVSMNSSGSENCEDVKIENLKNFYEAGGTLTVGTDLMRNYDTAMTALLDEMRVMLKAGLSLQEVIACATHNNAAALELDTGDIAVGLDADLIAVKGDVEENLEALESVDFVMNNGVVIVAPEEVMTVSESAAGEASVSDEPMAKSDGGGGGAKSAELSADIADLPSVESELWVEVSDERVGLEGPVFDEEGNLYVCSTGMSYPTNYIYKIDGDKNITTVWEGSLSPLGLAFHEDGRLFAVCRENTLLIMDKDGGNVTEITPEYDGWVFSMNDLVFLENGDLLFTDWQGTTDDPIGGIYILSEESGYKTATCLADGLIGPNGVSLSPDGLYLWVGMTNENKVYRITLAYEGDAVTAESIELIYDNANGGGQPDSNKTDTEGNFYQAFIQDGRILVFDSEGSPIENILMPDRMSNSRKMTSNLVIKPGTTEGYMLAAGFGEGSYIYTFDALANGK